MESKAGIGCAGGSECQFPVGNPALGDGKAKVDGRPGHALTKLPQISTRCLSLTTYAATPLDCYS